MGPWGLGLHQPQGAIPETPNQMVLHPPQDSKSLPFSISIMLESMRGKWDVTTYLLVLPLTEAVLGCVLLPNI